MLLGQDGYLVAEKIPVTCGLAQRDNGDEESGCRGKIGSLSATTSEQIGTQEPRMLMGNLAHLACLLLEQGELFDGPLKVVLSRVSGRNIGAPLIPVCSWVTLASNSAWGICWSTSLVKSLSGLNAAFAILGG